MVILKDQSMSRWPFNTLLIVWPTVAVGSAISHLFMPEWTAHGTTWASEVHWQREIAYFNILLSILFLWVARQDDASLKVKACWAIAGLSLVLGLNHLGGWLVAPKVFHVLFTLGNFAALLWGAGAILYANQRTRSI